MTRPVTRRRLLVGATTGALGALAGCQWLPGTPGSGDRPELDPAALVAVANRPGPKYSPSVPAPISSTHLAGRRTAVRAHLDAVPDELGPGDVPNEAVRNYVAEQRADARDALTSAGEAVTPAGTMDDLRSALGYAANADAAYRAATGDLSRDDVLAAASGLRDDIESFADYAYTATDATLAPASVLYATADGHVRDATRYLDNADENPGLEDNGAPLVGATAEYVTLARAHLADAKHLVAQFRDTLDGGRDAEPAFRDAVDALGDSLDVPCGALDDWADAGLHAFDRDIRRTPAGRLVEEFQETARFRCADVRDAREHERPAGILHALVAAHWDATAIERGATLIRDGRFDAVGGVADVRRARDRAVSAIADATDHPRWPALVNDGLAAAAGTVATGDDILSWDAEREPRRAARRAVAQYGFAEARAAVHAEAARAAARAL